MQTTENGHPQAHADLQETIKQKNNQKIPPPTKTKQDKTNISEQNKSAKRKKRWQTRETLDLGMVQPYGYSPSKGWK